MESLRRYIKGRKERFQTTMQSSADESFEGLHFGYLEIMNCEYAITDNRKQRTSTLIRYSASVTIHWYE